LNQESDQIWQQLRFHIDNIFSQTTLDDLQRIEYKPLFMALLEMPSESYQNDQQEKVR
jgi:hypothetical protein